jgi:uncharacterized protein YjiS (DUF1127 family)
MAYVNTSARATAGILDRLAALPGRLNGALMRRRLYWRTHSELGALSDRELADLGIARADIAAIAHEAAYGR